MNYEKSVMVPGITHKFVQRPMVIRHKEALDLFRDHINDNQRKYVIGNYVDDACSFPIGYLDCFFYDKELEEE